MSRFLQLHILTDYPPSNPNRDDLGKPKSAIVGGVQRQRISSQAIKRAIRIAPDFRAALEGHLGERTQRMGEEIIAHLTAQGVNDARASEIAKAIVPIFGKLETTKTPERALTAQLAFISPDEKKLAFALADKALAGEALPKDKELAKLALLAADGAVDIAMFGRMLADNPDFNREAAVQVSHAFTTSQVRLEDDYYTAVDDLKRPEENMGAGFVGEAGFGSGVYYVYICVSYDLLLDNLGGDAALARKGVEALVRAAATASPSGKKNSFANHVRAGYVLAERGDRQPRSLASAFTAPVKATAQANLMAQSITQLTSRRNGFAKAYGQDWDAEIVLDIESGDGASIAQVATFAAEGLSAP